MFLSPQTCRNNLSSFFKDKKFNRNKTKDDSNKFNKKNLSSRNIENHSNPKKSNYKKIIPSNLVQFSSNNSTSSNNSNLHNVRTHKNIFSEFELGQKDSDFIRRNLKHFKRQDSFHYLMNNTKERYDNLFQNYKKKINNKILYSKNNLTNIHNKTVSKNIIQDLLISSKQNKFNISSNVDPSKTNTKNSLINCFIYKDFNSNLNSNSKKEIISANFKNMKSAYNINSSRVISGYTSKNSSTGNIHTKISIKKMNSAKPHRPNSNDNCLIMNQVNNLKENKIIKLSKSKSKNKNFNKNNKYIKNSNNKSYLQKNIGNNVKLNNNKIEYVQINLFNNGAENKSSKDSIQIVNKIGKKKNTEKSRVIYKNKQNKKEAKITDDINNDKSGIQDNLNTTKNFLCFNDKTLTENDINTPEENHFQAIILMQLIKNNSNKYS